MRLGLLEPAAGLGSRRLREDWREASLRAGWTVPQDWWVPAVEAVVEALADGRDLAASCGLLGRERADAGVGLDEALTDLAALPARHARTDLPVRALAAGWAEVACDPARAGVCEDPLTGLTTSAYLRTRLAETYREAARTGVPVACSYALVVVAVHPVDGSRLRTMSRLLLVADGLRDAFSGGETLAGTGPAHAAALVQRESELPARVAALREFLAERLRQAGSPPARAWIESLPSSLAAAYQLLVDLTR